MHRPSRLTTHFLSAEDAARLIARKGVASCLQGMAHCLEQDYLRWHDFDKTARVASHSADGVIELMPIADAHTYTFKYVNGHPRNFGVGLPTVMAFGALADVETGTPLFVSELTLTTALRTAAMSALAARALARPGSRVMALIGNGAQSEFQALAFRHLLRIDTLHLYDVDPAATDRLVRNLQGSGLALVRCRSIAQAVQGADIVTTVTADKTHATILTADLLTPGMHINAVGGDCPGKTELHADVLQAGRVFVEYEPQTRIEGDLQQMPADFPVTELWRVLAGEAAGRTRDDEVTVFDSVGFALEDFSALRFMRAAASEMGLGQAISLVPHLRDPRDLFGLIRDAAAASPSPAHAAAPAH